MKYDFLIDEAFDAMKNSYSPYSNYCVGSCLICKDGSKYIGTNIENAAYGSTMCAERVAIYAAYSNGKRKNDIEAIAIVSNGDTIAYSCGACRQVMSELLNHDIPIIFSNRKETKVLTMAELLPHSFSNEDLNI